MSMAPMSSGATSWTERAKNSCPRWLVGNWRARGGGPDQARVRHRPQARLEALTRARVRPGAASGPPSEGVVIVDQPSRSLLEQLLGVGPGRRRFEQLPRPASQL